MKGSLSSRKGLQLEPWLLSLYSPTLLLQKKYTPGLLLIIDFYAITRTLLGLCRIIMMTVVKSD